MNNTASTQAPETPVKTICKCDHCQYPSTTKGRRQGALLVIFVVITWMMGAVIAKGFWSTLAAYICPPWAWYLLTERAMQLLLGPAWL